ncbi:unnamed protein product [Moneuplotes crassus]|uniref:Uncharacterized protein n=1 Tax=Euplotes crassus TaxID=5936 RepID=A0AAD1XXT7_EUPCR|nr:unnamed protein product [Moneuplotes crassus]
MTRAKEMPRLRNIRNGNKMIKKGMHSAMIMQMRKIKTNPKSIHLDHIPTPGSLQRHRSIVEKGKILPPKNRLKSPYLRGGRVQEFVTNFPRRLSKLPDAIRPSFPQPQHWAINIEKPKTPSKNKGDSIILESEHATDMSRRDSFKIGQIQITTQEGGTFDKTECKLPETLSDSLESESKKKQQCSPSFHVVRMEPTPKKKIIKRNRIRRSCRRDKTMSQHFKLKRPELPRQNVDLKDISNPTNYKSSFAKNPNKTKEITEAEVTIPMHLKTESFKLTKKLHSFGKHAKSSSLGMNFLKEDSQADTKRSNLTTLDNHEIISKMSSSNGFCNLQNWEKIKKIKSRATPRVFKVQEQILKQDAINSKKIKEACKKCVKNSMILRNKARFVNQEIEDQSLEKSLSRPTVHPDSKMMNYILELLEQDRSDKGNIFKKCEKCKAEDIKVINETGMRRTFQCFHRSGIKKFRNMKSNPILLKHMYAKNFMKYDLKVLGSQKEQFFILYGELEIFKKKALILKAFFQRTPPCVSVNEEGENVKDWNSFYCGISKKHKKKLNNMLKELLIILYDVSNIVLQELADEPEKIGIDPVKYLYELHMNLLKDIKLTYEAEFVAHIELLEDMVEFYSSSVYVYLILNRSYERPIIKVPRVKKCIDKIMKGTSFSIELTSVFKEMYKNMKNHKQIQDNIEEIEKLVKPDSPPEEPKPTFLNTLISLGWTKKSKENKETDAKENTQRQGVPRTAQMAGNFYETPKNIKNVQMRMLKSQRNEKYNDEQREL